MTQAADAMQILRVIVNVWDSFAYGIWNLRNMIFGSGRSSTCHSLSLSVSLAQSCLEPSLVIRMA